MPTVNSRLRHIVIFNLETEIHLKINHFALICMLMSALFCASQTTPQPPAPDTSTAQTPATAPSQTPQQAPAAEKPAAGQTSNQSSSTSPSPDKDKGKDNKDKDASATSKDRLFFALPNFLSVEQNGGQILPLTAGQKFKVVARGAFDPIQIVWYGALSGISQAENSEPGYGQGAAGYGKRYGAYAADGTIENFFVGAILPSVLHQDPRFFPTIQGSFFKRTGYAVSRIVVTRGDSGRKEFNFSEVFGSAMASAISTYSYHPRRTFNRFSSTNVPEYYASDRTLKNTASVWVTQMGYDTITLVVKEFWPDIRRKMKKQPH